MAQCITGSAAQRKQQWKPFRRTMGEGGQCYDKFHIFISRILIFFHFGERMEARDRNRNKYILAGILLCALRFVGCYGQDDGNYPIMSRFVGLKITYAAVDTNILIIEFLSLQQQTAFN
jgi:hypothetical protein